MGLSRFVRRQSKTGVAARRREARAYVDSLLIRATPEQLEQMAAIAAANRDHRTVARIRELQLEAASDKFRGRDYNHVVVDDPAPRAVGFHRGPAFHGWECDCGELVMVPESEPVAANCHKCGAREPVHVLPVPVTVAGVDVDSGTVTMGTGA